MSRFWYNLPPIIQKSDCRGIFGGFLEEYVLAVYISQRMWLNVKNLKLFRNCLVVR